MFLEARSGMVTILGKLCPYLIYIKFFIDEILNKAIILTFSILYICLILIMYSYFLNPIQILIEKRLQPGALEPGILEPRTLEPRTLQPRTLEPRTLELLDPSPSVQDLRLQYSVRSDRGDRRERSQILPRPWLHHGMVWGRVWVLEVGVAGLRGRVGRGPGLGLELSQLAGVGG